MSLPRKFFLVVSLNFTQVPNMPLTIPLYIIRKHYISLCIIIYIIIIKCYWQARDKA